MVKTQKPAAPGTAPRPKAQAKAPRPKPRGFSLAQKDDNAGPVLGIFGQGGTGKTHTLVGALLEGEKLVGASSDFGGDGLDTVIGILKSMGRPELLENILNVNLTDWDDIGDFARDPQQFFETNLTEWGATVCFLEGYTSAQLVSLEEKLVIDDMGMTELRDWNKVKRNTLRVLVRFLDIKFGDVSPAKIITFLENVKEDDNSRQTTGPHLQGAARNLMMPAMDIMMRTTRNKQGYQYTFRDDTGKVDVKIRARPGVPDTVKADPVKLWRAVRSSDYKWQEGK